MGQCGFSLSLMGFPLNLIPSFLQNLHDIHSCLIEEEPWKVMVAWLFGLVLVNIMQTVGTFSQMYKTYFFSNLWTAFFSNLKNFLPCYFPLVDNPQFFVFSLKGTFLKIVRVGLTFFLVQCIFRNSDFSNTYRCLVYKKKCGFITSWLK